MTGQMESARQVAELRALSERYHPEEEEAATEEGGGREEAMDVAPAARTPLKVLDRPPPTHTLHTAHTDNTRAQTRRWSCFASSLPLSLSLSYTRERLPRSFTSSVSLQLPLSHTHTPRTHNCTHKNAHTWRPMAADPERDATTIDRLSDQGERSTLTRS